MDLALLLSQIHEVLDGLVAEGGRLQRCHVEGEAEVGDGAETFILQFEKKKILMIRHKLH